MNIIINGESREFKSGITLTKLLKELSLEGKVMAAAINMDIVKQSDWETYILQDEDKLELLDFVGGGQSIWIATTAIAYSPSCVMETDVSVILKFSINF